MSNVEVTGLKEARKKMYYEFGALSLSSRDKISALMKGAIDTHMHPGPTVDAVPRFDVYEAALQAKAAGMRAFVFKNHHYCTAPLAEVVNRLVPHFTVVGGVCIDTVSTGGFNIHTIKQAAEYGAKVIWFPTLDAPKLKAFSGRTGGLSVLDSSGNVLPVVTEILEVCKKFNMVVVNGHMSFTESLAMFKEAKRVGVSKLLAAHVRFSPHPQLYPPFSLEEQKQFADLGVLIEHSYREAEENMEEYIAQVRAVGADRCVIGTDTGQLTTPTPVECMRLMITKLLAHGFSEQEIKAMSSTNASKLLDLG